MLSPVPAFLRQRGRRLAVLALVLLANPIAAAASPRWQQLEHFLQDRTGAHGYTGAVALVEHNGDLVFAGHYGHQDIARTQPMRDDSIFRIYSMTKPVASVAALLLMEEGRLGLDDPVARHLPEFSRLQMIVADSPQAQQQGPLSRPLTVRHLLTHTSGLAVDREQHPAATAKLLQADLDNATSLTDVAARLAATPLAEPSGTHFHYQGANTDLLARVVEAASGQTFTSFVQQRIFIPLGMRDTGFEVPPEQRHRVVDLPTSDADGALVLSATASAKQPGVRLKGYDSAAGGLYSTAADYLRFARMLLGKGHAGNPPLLSRKTRQLMMADQLATAFPAPVEGFSRGEGFGLGGYVVTDVAARGRLGSVGQFGWSGAASTYFTVDPSEELVAILLLQYVDEGHHPPLPSLATPFYNLVYQALD